MDLLKSTFTTLLLSLSLLLFSGCDSDDEEKWTIDPGTLMLEISLSDDYFNYSDGIKVDFLDSDGNPQSKEMTKGLSLLIIESGYIVGSSNYSFEIKVTPKGDYSGLTNADSAEFVYDIIFYEGKSGVPYKKSDLCNNTEIETFMNALKSTSLFLLEGVVGID